MSHHLRLPCFVSVELKIENFKQEFDGWPEGGITDKHWGSLNRRSSS
ncbi:hypothetical protein GOD21_26785 [Sinorhizobium medicae]|nr:hypothetical protein [Sinorhizobium medicae]